MAVADWMTSEEPVRLGKLHHDHPLFAGVFARAPRRVDLPTVRGWHARSRSGSLERNLMSFADGKAVFDHRPQRPWAGTTFARRPWTPKWSNLAQHALLVPTCAEGGRNEPSHRTAAVHRGERSRCACCKALDRVAGGSLALRPAAGDASERLLLESGTVPGGVEVYLPLRDAAEPGILPHRVHRCRRNNSDSVSVVMALGINPSRKESDLTIWDAEDWKQALTTEGWRRSDVISSDVEDLIERWKC